MIDLLTSPMSDSAAGHPALLWILAITLFAIATVLMRDGWRWFIALGKTDEPAQSEAHTVAEDIEASSAEMGAPVIVSPFDRRSPTNPSTGFGRRRTDHIGFAQSAG